MGLTDLSVAWRLASVRYGVPSGIALGIAASVPFFAPNGAPQTDIAAATTNDISRIYIVSLVPSRLLGKRSRWHWLFCADLAPAQDAATRRFAVAAEGSG
jgi:hypothetical protein